MITWMAVKACRLVPSQRNLVNCVSKTKLPAERDALTCCKYNPIVCQYDLVKEYSQK
jgi:hypothetical protein